MDVGKGPLPGLQSSIEGRLITGFQATLGTMRSTEGETIDLLVKSPWF